MPERFPYHLQQIASLCRNHPVTAKVVFVSSRRIGHKLSTALAASGQPWMNLYLTTPYEWAKRTVQPVLTGEGWRELTAGADLLIVEDLIRTSDIDVELAPETLGRAAATTLPALRMANVGSEKLLDQEEGQKTVQQLVAQLSDRYNAYLQEHKLYDEATIYRRALGEHPAENKAVFGILDEVELSKLAADYVEQLAEGSPCPLQRVGRPGYAVGFLPPHSAAKRFEDQPLVAVPAEQKLQIGPGGFLWEEGRGQKTTGTLDVAEVLGTANAVRDVLRKVQQKQLACDEVELVYTSELEHLSQVYSLLKCYRIPATFSGGLPVAITRPGRALTLFFEWITTGFEPAVLVRLLASGAFKRVNDLEPWEAASLLRKAQPGTGEDQYFAALNRLERDQKKTDQAKAVPVERLRGLLRRLFALVPERHTSLSEMVSCTEAFLDQFVQCRDEETFPVGEAAKSLDQEAVETLVKRFHSLSRLVTTERPRQQLVRQFLEQLSRHKVADASPRPGCIHVTDLKSAGYTNRKHLFVVGLNQSVFPGGSSEDPLLLDHVRRQVSSELPLRANGPAEQNWHLVRVLGVATGQATLICSRRNIAGDRPLYPSAAFLRARKLAEKKPKALSLLPEPLPAEENHTAWLAQTMLSEAETGMGLRQADGWQKKVVRRYPWLEKGKRAQQQRAEEALTSCDGLVEADQEVLSLKGQTLSASRLETLTACPYQYFLQYVLDIEPVEELEKEEKDQWLDSKEFGSLLHRLFRRFMQHLCKQGESVDQKKHHPVLEKFLAEEVEQQEELLPPPNAAAQQRDVERLRTCLRIFLAAEQRHGKTYKPTGFEVSFGRGETPEQTLGQAGPVEIELSDTLNFKLQGSIDRVDVDPEGAYEIWDYKTGSAYGFNESDLFSEGKKLQWALYAHALTKMTGQTVQRSGYFFPTDRVYGHRMVERMPGASTVADLLEPLFEMVENGYFLQAASRDNCTYCDYQRICGDTNQRKKELKGMLTSDGLSDQEKEMLKHWNYG